MARRAFFSFYYKPDNWRVGQVRSMGIIEGNAPVSDNDWGQITEKGDESIEKWINGQLEGKSCSVVLIGSNTAGRKWINYEIKKTWNDGKGLVGIHIHNLKDSEGKQCLKGTNPFANLTVGEKKLFDIVKVYDPPYTTSTYVYDHIKENLEKWVEEAMKIRENN